MASVVHVGPWHIDGERGQCLIRTTRKSWRSPKVGCNSGPYGNDFQGADNNPPSIRFRMETGTPRRLIHGNWSFRVGARLFYSSCTHGAGQVIIDFLRKLTFFFRRGP